MGVFKKSNGRTVRIAGFAVLALLAIGVWWLVSKLAGEVLNTASKVEFIQQMPVPPLAESTVTASGTRVFNLNLQTGTTNFFKNFTTDTWGVNGNYLGPTLRAARGENVLVNVKNNLPEETSIHWHGMHLPAKMDGGPHQPIASAATWSPSWGINQPAATLWYHPHPHGKTETHVERGVAGMFIVDDATITSSNLPNTYGVDDVPVIVQDKEFDSKKQFKLRSSSGPTGRIGDQILVNGAITPYMDVTTQRVRLRILNASTARIYNFGLVSGNTMQLVATDGGLLEKPTSLQRILLSPGERAEIILTMHNGERDVLRSYPVDLEAGIIAARRMGSQDTLDVLQLRAVETLAPSAEIPSQLAAIQRLSESTAIQTRRFRLDSDRSINKKTMDLRRVDFSVTRGDTEIWEVTNMGGSPHSFHIHDVQFQVLANNGTNPPEWQGWKDTVLIKEGQTARLIMKFTDYSDTTVPYMYHCHLLRHEDQGMMGQFVVTEPGVKAPSILPMSDHLHTGDH